MHCVNLHTRNLKIRKKGYNIARIRRVITSKATNLSIPIRSENLVSMVMGNSINFSSNMKNFRIKSYRMFEKMARSFLIFQGIEGSKVLAEAAHLARVTQLVRKVGCIILSREAILAAEATSIDSACKGVDVDEAEA